MHRVRLLVLVCYLALASALLPATLTVHAATINVTTTTDEFGAGTGCSLREAIHAANTDAAFGGCPAGSGFDTISLPAGTYALTLLGAGEDLNATGDLDVTSDLSIVGAGAASTIIDGNDTDRVLHVIGIVNTTIDRVTIQNGNISSDGGGVYVPAAGAVITVINAVVRNNDATGRGGGLHILSANSTVASTTVSGNTAGASGGGIDIGAGNLNLTNTTVTNNTATGSGGGVSTFNGGVTIATSAIATTRPRLAAAVASSPTMAPSC